MTAPDRTYLAAAILAAADAGLLPGEPWAGPAADAILAHWPEQASPAAPPGSTARGPAVAHADLGPLDIDEITGYAQALSAELSRALSAIKARWWPGAATPPSPHPRHV